jgi:uncharacterized membrane protein YfcA
VFSCGVFFAAAAGIGGGGLNVPFFILLFYFEIEEVGSAHHGPMHGKL